MNVFKALVMREILDGKSYYIRTPVILAGLTFVLLVLSTLLLGNIHIDNMDSDNVKNIGEGMTYLHGKEPEQVPFAVALMYWGLNILPWIAFPFVIFFSLLGTLYEERRDRSIMFWKSMPVADWQEVLAKLFVPLVVAPIVVMAVTIAAQLITAIFLGIVVLFQGGPAMEMFPLGLMITSWFMFFGHYIFGALWALPLLAWLLLVSSYASRMPFLWAVLPPFILIAIEGIFFKSFGIAKWIAIHMGGWREALEERIVAKIDGPRDLFELMISSALSESAALTFSSVNMWGGLVIAGGFVYGAIEMRKRAI